MDTVTTLQYRGQFARICVELDLSKVLVPQVVVRNEPLKVVYEGLHAICFSSGVYGHKKEACSPHFAPMQSPEGPVQASEQGAKGNMAVDNKSEQEGNHRVMSVVSAPRKAISVIDLPSQQLINAEVGKVGVSPPSDMTTSPFGP